MKVPAYNISVSTRT